ncbi:HEPN family nuclease [Desulfovibrio aminophilus]|uniref:HEPN family nuclease n=1 Tax=Desulfovibrio aminophilus TaxID=81425 RepID=UPI00048957F6|nr:HEPN family nuclease [Desulfovibrio aminophilus]
MEYRDVVRDFAERTKKNLETIDRLRDLGEEVYETTQLINSMLGLLVFPREEFVDRIPQIPFADLARAGWPTPNVRNRFPQARDLRQLIRYLRNAIAHFNLEFLSDGEHQISGLRVWNTRPGSRVTTWDAELSLDDLRNIAERFTSLLLAEAV